MIQSMLRRFAQKVRRVQTVYLLLLAVFFCGAYFWRPALAQTPPTMSAAPAAVSPQHAHFEYFSFLHDPHFSTLERVLLFVSVVVALAALAYALMLPFPVLLGMVLIGVGTFFAQATATGFVSRAATADRGSASGIYLACYFAGGLVGTAILGQIFDRVGWAVCVAGIALSLAVAAVLALRLKTAD